MKLVSCYIWYSDQGTGWGRSSPRPLFASEVRQRGMTVPGHKDSKPERPVCNQSRISLSCIWINPDIRRIHFPGLNRNSADNLTLDYRHTGLSPPVGHRLILFV